jgi:hypothetical protein
MNEFADENHVDVCGTVLTIWRRETGIYARLVIPSKNTGTVPTGLNLKIPLEKILGKRISLMVGDHVQVSGWIGDEPYFESLREFAARAKYPIRLDAHLDLDRFDGLGVKRSIAVVVPETVRTVQDPGALNSVIVEGIVARAWEHKQDKYVRLAVHHSKSPAAGTGHDDLPKQQIPHYVSVRFTGGHVDDRCIKLIPKRQTDVNSGIALHDRLIVFGEIAESCYSQSLHAFLVDAKRLDVLNAIPDASEAANIWSSYSQTVIAAKHIVHCA